MSVYFSATRVIFLTEIYNHFTYYSKLFIGYLLSILFIYLFSVYFWLCWVFLVVHRLFIAAHRPSLVVSGRPTTLQLQCAVSHCSCFFCCGFWASVVMTCRLQSMGPELWHTGLFAPWHVESQFPDQGSNLCCLHWHVDY